MSYKAVGTVGSTLWGGGTGEQYTAGECPGCEWDPGKVAENQRKHDFEDPIRDVVEDARDYGERRFIATGRVGNVILVVVFTERDGRGRIISARKAEPRERRAYYARTRSLGLTTATSIPKGGRIGRALKR
jgi:uncharacterized DUF497 family protein